MENKTLLEKLKKAGVDAKSHMSVLDPDEIAKIDAAPEDEHTEANYDEKRITPGVIRRRRKETPPAAAEVGSPEKSAAKEEPEHAEPVSSEEETEIKPEPTEVPLSEPAELSQKEVPVEPEEGIIEAKETEAVEEKAIETGHKPESETAAAKEASQEVPEKKTPSVKKSARPSQPQAKILGHVDIGKTRKKAEEKPPKPAPEVPTEVKEVPAPLKQPEQKPDSASPRPGLEPEQAKKRAAPKEARGAWKKQKLRVVDLTEDFELEEGRAKRTNKREVFEPKRTDKQSRGRKAAKQVKKTEVTVPKAIKRIIRISESITVGELAKRMGVKAGEIIKELMKQGTMATINHPLDYDSAVILASDFGYEVENIAFDEETVLQHHHEEKSEEAESDKLKHRSPVVTIMGHVDHGKTSLLDAIRTTNVIAGEAGGITQHIGAYKVELEGKPISFLDTPGHEAFTSMRARGAQVTDIVILVVAADDGVMPQTKEAINHAKAAEVPIIVAINKIDKPQANPDKVKQELTEFGLVPEDWGGDTIFVEVSAKQKMNLDELLEMILLQAEVMELKANPEKLARGTIVEARLDKGRGPVATVLIQEGTLKVGDPVVTGTFYGSVRSMANDRGIRLKTAGPSDPVEITGLSGVPDAGDNFYSLEDERSARDVAQHRLQKVREAELAKSSKISLDQLYARIQEGDVKELNVILKGDVQGSVEAVRESLSKLSTDSCRLVVIHSGVGGITESDVSLASASDAIILGFNVRPESKASSLAENEGVDIRLYNIIYDAVADIRDAMEGLLAPTFQEKALGRVEIRETFNISKVGTVAGCYVQEGKILRNAQVRLVRDSVVVWQGKLNSLKRFKDDVREVASGYECGIALEGYNDIKPGDILEAFELEEIKSKLV
jgi:translation initiation factor IF-2